MKGRYLAVWVLLLVAINISLVARQEAEEGRRIYVQRCTPCHGKDGTRGAMGAKESTNQQFDGQQAVYHHQRGQGYYAIVEKETFPEPDSQCDSLYQNPARNVQPIMNMTTKKMQHPLLILTATTTALIAGLFYAYSCSVNPGLGRLTDAQYMAAMQAINDAILNPLFMFSFLGTLLLLPISTYGQYGSPSRLSFYLLLAATAVYTVGVFGVTALGNVPLNDALAKFDLQHATAAEVSEQRRLFEQPWNNLHRVRSIASFVCIVLVVAACVYDKD